jgi:4-aminobutyrate aminotransferase/(S)-3-amino-2-methylpropionate transaminase
MSHPGLGPLLPHLTVPPPGPASRALAERLRAVESRNVTQISDEWPVFWKEARGCNVRDADGNVYLDLTSAFGVALLGHGHPGVVEALRTQARHLLHGMGDVHPPIVKVRVMERLADLAPWPETRVVLSSTGSEAVETALKTVQIATGRPGVLAFEGAYHGLTFGALAATHRDHFRAPFVTWLYGGVAFAPFPDTRRHGPDAAARSLARVEELLARGAPNGDPIGAVIVEPVQGRAGARVAPEGFMARLSRLAQGAGALVVADEVFTGLGRCGAFLASGRVGLDPDVVCLGKALGGGFPVSACLGRREVMDAWLPSLGEAIHTSTFLGHPLGCAAASAVLDAFETEAVEARARLVGGRLVAALRRAFSSSQAVAEVRGLGLLVGIELADGASRQPARGAGVRVAQAALREGLLLLPAGDHGQVVGLTPALELTDEQLSYAVEVLTRTVREVAS